MPVYNFTDVLVWGWTGGYVSPARSVKSLKVIDPLTGLTPTLTQGGVTVGFLISDASGEVVFTATVAVVQADFGFGLRTMYSNERLAATADAAPALAAAAAAQAGVDELATGAAGSLMVDTLRIPNSYVKLTGTQTVAGWKDFTTAPTVNGAPIAGTFNVKDYGAVGNGVTNDTAAITAAYTAAAVTGGVVQFAAGVYFCGTINHTSAKVTIAGSGSGGGTVSGDFTGTRIKTTSGSHGIIITGQGATVRDLCITSDENGVGTSDGIQIRKTKVRLVGVTVEKFGRRGIDIDSTTANCNLFSITDCNVYWCGGDGVRANAGTDVNAGTLDRCDIYGNGGYGVYNIGSANAFLNMHYLSNTSGAVYDNGMGNVYTGYIESPQAFVVGANSINGVYENLSFGGVKITGDLYRAARWRQGYGGGFRARLPIYEGASDNVWILDSGEAASGSFRIHTDAGPTIMRGERTGALGFYGATPVVRAAAITTPTSDTVGTKAAIDAIRVALASIGITL